VTHGHTCVQHIKKRKPHVNIVHNQAILNILRGGKLIGIQGLCSAWHKGVRSVLNLPQSTHLYLIPSICDCLPILETIFRRSTYFARDCILHKTGLIKQIASYGIFYARSESPLGRNTLFRIDKYRSLLHSLLFSSYHFNNSYFYTTVDDAQLRTSIASHAN
jgi:hypothetical protein